MRKVRTSRVIFSSGDWCCSVYGIENTARPYPIPAIRLWESDWVRHLSGKRWNGIGDFEKVLTFARDYHAKKKPKNIGTLTMEVAR